MRVSKERFFNSLVLSITFCGNVVVAYTADDEPGMDLNGMIPMGGRGLSTMTRPTT
jgi:hypothetical protein